MIARDEAERLVTASKDCGGANLAWRPMVSPARGVVIRKTFELVVAVQPAPSEGELVIEGLWTGADHIQLFLRLVRGRQEGNLARLCLDPAHGDDLHWHFYEAAKGQTVRESVSYPSDMLTEEVLLDEVFIPRLNITNVARTLL